MSDVLVLSYHAVSERWPAALSVTPTRLEEQLRLLVDRGYAGRTFTEAVRERDGGRVLAVTFDDGYRSVLELALPILSRLGLPGTVFVPTDFPGGGPMAWPGIDGWLGTEHEHELQPLSWDELRRLQDAGWEIGSHACSHPHLTRLGDAELERELGRVAAPARDGARPALPVAGLPVRRPRRARRPRGGGGGIRGRGHGSEAADGAGAARLAADRRLPRQRPAGVPGEGLADREAPSPQPRLGRSRRRAYPFRVAPETSSGLPRTRDRHLKVYPLKAMRTMDAHRPPLHASAPLRAARRGPRGGARTRCARGRHVRPLRVSGR